MAERIVVFGATGYTGDLVSRALVDRGARPVLAARNEARVRALAEELGGLEWAVADVDRPDTVRALVERGDVLVSTVGPFARWGEPAVQAAIAAGAHYLDSTGEGSFIREVFERFGPGAQAAGCGLVTAFGYDWVPGNLAGALALRDAGEAATSVQIGYFNPGTGAGSMSGGTRASSASVMLSPGFAWHGGRLVGERAARHGRAFEIFPGKRARAISVASLRALRAAASPSDAARRRRLPGLVRPGLGADARRCRPGCRSLTDGPRRAAAPWTRCSAASGQGLDRRPRRRGARDEHVGRARRGLRRRRHGARRRCAWRASTATTSRPRFLAWGAETAARGGLQGDGGAGAGGRLRARRARRRAARRRGSRGVVVGLPRSAARRLRRCAARTASMREGSERRSRRGRRPWRVGARTSGGAP